MEEDKQNQAETSRGNPNIKEYAHLGGQAREGTKNKKTLAKEEAWKTYEQTMVDALCAITKAQLIVALGSHMIFRIDKETINGKEVRKKPVRVTEEWEIEHYVDLYVNEELRDDPDAPFYFATAIDPNTSAITDILDRLNGRPRQTTDVTTNGKDLPTPIINLTHVQPNNITE